jgi:hypothetical protein
VQEQARSSRRNARIHASSNALQGLVFTEVLPTKHRAIPSPSKPVAPSDFGAVGRTSN